MEINFIDETNQVPPAQQKEVDSLLQFAADFLNLPEETEMSVTFMNNDAIQEINRVYRQKDVPTDVISFAFEETGEEFEEDAEDYLKDLDIIGKNSLFQYISVCKTIGGKRILFQKLSNKNQEEEKLYEAITFDTVRLIFQMTTFIFLFFL